MPQLFTVMHHLGLSSQNFESPILSFGHCFLNSKYSSCKFSSKRRFCLCTFLPSIRSNRYKFLLGRAHSRVFIVFIKRSNSLYCCHIESTSFLAFRLIQNTLLFFKLPSLFHQTIRNTELFTGLLDRSGIRDKSE